MSAIDNLRADGARAFFVQWVKERVAVYHDDNWEYEYRVMATSFACEDMETGEPSSFHQMILNGTVPDMSTVAGTDKYFAAKADEFLVWDFVKDTLSPNLDEDAYRAAKNRVDDYLALSTREAN